MLPPLSTRDARTLARASHILERQLRHSDLPKLDTILTVKAYLCARFAGLDHEQVHALYLDAGLVLIAAEIVTVGTLTCAHLHPREVARAALRHNAAAVILAHNHPSGSVAPSESDVQLTITLRAALSLIEVQLVDHLVVAGAQVSSAASKGLL